MQLKVHEGAGSFTTGTVKYTMIPRFKRRLFRRYSSIKGSWETCVFLYISDKMKANQINLSKIKCTIKFETP